MIQINTILNIIDNSGAKTASCIKVLSGYKRRYASIGDLILVSIKTLRSKRKIILKLKKGELYKAIILRTCSVNRSFTGDNINFFDNSIVLLTKQNKFLGTRVFGTVPKKFKSTKFFKLLTLASGITI